jgi:hypothetical protein
VVPAGRERRLPLGREAMEQNRWVTH